MCQIVSAKKKTSQNDFPPRTILTATLEQSTVRGLVSSSTILQLNSKTRAHCSASPSQQQNHWIAACLYYQHAHTQTHTAAGGLSVKPHWNQSSGQTIMCHSGSLFMRKITSFTPSATVPAVRKHSTLFLLGHMPRSELLFHLFLTRVAVLSISCVGRDKQVNLTGKCLYWNWIYKYCV